jgi:hypothetical protein
MSGDSLWRSALVCITCKQTLNLKVINCLYGIAPFFATLDDEEGEECQICMNVRKCSMLRFNNTLMVVTSRCMML